MITGGIIRKTNESILDILAHDFWLIFFMKSSLSLRGNLIVSNLIAIMMMIMMTIKQMNAHAN